ncbi:hypothetical protein GCM10027026_07610 [Myroides odoratimimus subsp. xuanwuensis]
MPGGSADGTSDALYAVGTPHRICAPSEHHSAFSEGFDTFANRGPAPVTIDRVEWPTEGDLAVTSVSVFQREPGDIFATLGIWGGLPPGEMTDRELRAWQRAEPADGAVLDLADDGERYLVFVVGFTGTSGSGGPLTVHFTDADGREGSATSLAEVRVSRTC